MIYKTKHIAVKHVYDCSAGFSNWQSGWSSAKKDYCCSHESRGCPGDHSGHLTKTVVTGVTENEGPTYYHHHSHTAFGGNYGDTVIDHGGSWAGAVDTAGAMDGSTMDDGGIVSGAMDGSTMDDGGIVSGAMDGSTMDDGSIVSGAMDGSTMDDGGIVSGTMDGSTMDDGGIVSGAMDGSTMDDGGIVSGAMDGSTMDDGGIVSGAMDGSTMDDGGIVSGAMDGSTMDDGGIVSGAMDGSTMDDGGIVSGAMDGSTMDDGGIVSGAMDGSTMDDGGIVSGAMDGSTMDDGSIVSGGSGSFSHVSHVSSSWRDLKDESKKSKEKSKDESKEKSKEKSKDEPEEKSRRLQSFPEGDEFGIPGTLEDEGAMVGSEGAIEGGEGAMVGGEGVMVGGEGAIEGGIGGGGVIGGGESIPDGGVQGGMFGQEDPAFHHVIHHVVPMPVMHSGYSHTITHPAPIAPVPKADVHTIVHRHYGTVYRKIPVNHYVKVQMPQQPPIVNTVKIQAPPTHYDCGLSGSPDPIWTEKHKRWCCWKMQGNYCPKQVIDKNIYHTVVKTQPVRVPVPEPMPTHAPIVHTVKHTYHVPSPPEYVHVHVPGPTVVKHVTVPERVPVPVPEPPKVIDVKQPYTVHVPGPDHYVKVPVPSPPHVVTKYHTQWNTVVDHDSDIHTYDCASGATMWHSAWSHAKQIWCCSHQQIGCPGTWSSGTSGVTHYHTYGHGNWPTDQMV